MTSVAARRLLKEYRQLMDEAPEGLSAGPIDEDNLFEWECLIEGPGDTPFEGGVFPATLSFPKVRTRLSLPPTTLRAPTNPPSGLSSKPAKNAIHMRDVPPEHLQGRDGLHQHSAPPGRRPEPVRVRERAMEPDTERGEDIDLSHEHACGAER